MSLEYWLNEANLVESENLLEVIQNAKAKLDPSSFKELVAKVPAEKLVFAWQMEMAQNDKAADKVWWKEISNLNFKAAKRLKDMEDVDPWPMIDMCPKLLVGSRVRKYEVLEYIGGGGFGRVYKVVLNPGDKEHETFSAMKVIPHEKKVSAGELKVTNKLTDVHNIVKISHAHRLKKYKYTLLFMNLMKENLGNNKRLNEKERLLLWITQVARTLRELHEKGIVHLDIKPENILLDIDDNAYLCDLGLAQVLNDPKAIDIRGGTTGYMAPELVELMTPLPEQKTLGHLETTVYKEGRPECKDNYKYQWDVFSFGVTIYEILTGQKIVGDRQPIRLAFKGFEDNPYFYDCLDEFLSKCLAFAPEERFLSGTELYEQWLEVLSCSDTLQNSEFHKDFSAELSGRTRLRSIPLRQHFDTAFKKLRVGECHRILDQLNDMGANIDEEKKKCASLRGIKKALEGHLNELRPIDSLTELKKLFFVNKYHSSWDDIIVNVLEGFEIEKIQQEIGEAFQKSDYLRAKRDCQNSSCDEILEQANRDIRSKREAAFKKLRLYLLWSDSQKDLSDEQKSQIALLLGHLQGPDSELRKRWYLRAYELGSYESIRALGNLYWEEDNYQTANNYFSKVNEEKEHPWIVAKDEALKSLEREKDATIQSLKSKMKVLTGTLFCLALALTVGITYNATKTTEASQALGGKLRNIHASLTEPESFQSGLKQLNAFFQKRVSGKSVERSFEQAFFRIFTEATDPKWKDTENNADFHTLINEHLPSLNADQRETMVSTLNLIKLAHKVHLNGNVVEKFEDRFKNSEDQLKSSANVTLADVNNLMTELEAQVEGLEAEKIKLNREINLRNTKLNTIKDTLASHNFGSEKTNFNEWVNDLDWYLTERDTYFDILDHSDLPKNRGLAVTKWLERCHGILKARKVSAPGVILNLNKSEREPFEF